ncbi:Nramp family divalent metal transporter [uncultured Jatrophihabitans sp.]|uniref:Nramp family divalent metal transporter n=1 Tax=uncultured Jatrophihabitans sp. TaxID=1610747 RepID=UPI0035CA05D1
MFDTRTAGHRGPVSDDAEPSSTAADPAVGERSRWRVAAGLVGPAFVASVAYIDPGNFATNFSAGAKYGYTLIWVVVVANVMAMLVQYQSAKVGVVTGRDLPELCRERFPRTASTLLWVQAEVVAMATDIAEFVGAAIGLNLLFGVPLLPAGLITAVVAFVILGLEQHGRRRFELVVVALLALVLSGFLYDLASVGAHASAVAGGLVPHFAGADSVVLAAGIVGATVMPHVVYLHSALTKNLSPFVNDRERRSVLRVQRLDVVVALGLAGVINVVMLVVAAAVFSGLSGQHADSIVAAHAGLAELAGGGTAVAFAVALLASGLSSSSVGTYAGQVVMAGYLRRQVPLFVRRGVTMLPALVVLGLGLPLTSTLVVSQVLLSFGVPFALVPLTMLSRRADVMGPHANRATTTALMSAVAATIITLNAYLLYAVLH